MFTTVDEKRRDREAAMHTGGAALAPEHSRGGSALEPQLRRVCADVLSSLCKVLVLYTFLFSSFHCDFLTCRSTESPVLSSMCKHIALVPVYILVDSGRVVRAARAAARVRTAAGAVTGARAQCSATKAARRLSPRRARGTLVHILVFTCTRTSYVNILVVL